MGSTAVEKLLLASGIDVQRLGSPPGRFALQKILRFPTNWTLVGFQSPSGGFEEETKL
jgi:hypothetical protein